MAKNKMALRASCRLLLVALASLSLQVVAASAEGITGDTAFLRGDYVTAFRDWTSEALAGDASAMGAVGVLYDTGHGVSQDFALALSWYRRAAEAGDVTAMFNVGVMNDNGRGTPTDREQAVRWYRLAADHGSGRAAFSLGLIYRDGDGVPRDNFEATRYFHMADASGIQAAKANLIALGARSLVNRPPGASNRTLDATRRAPFNAAAEIGRFQTAALSRSDVDSSAVHAFAAVIPAISAQAANGNRLAQYDIGYAYERGVGVKQDVAKAYVYYLRASTTSDERVKEAALKGAAEIGKRMTSAQHAAARDMMLEDRP